MGVFELRSTLSMDTPNAVILILSSDGDGMVQIDLVDVHEFKLDPPFPYNNLLQKWSKLCISFDFTKNEAQAGINGRVAKFVKDPDTLPNYKGKIDGGMLAKENSDSELTFIVGRYGFDKNPFIGTIAGINVWNRTMNTEELKTRTSCKTISIDKGNLISEETNWNLTATLVNNVNVSLESLKCTKYTEKVTAFLPIPALNREEAVDLCHKLGDDVYIAGEFENETDFEVYYNGLYSNSWYVERCGFYDNGRIKTWLPYKQNQAGTALIHEVTGKVLFASYYVDWYDGPEGVFNENQCGAAYFGIVPYKQNIHEDSCISKKCTACQLQNSFDKTSTVKLRGLCKYSFFDTSYHIKYSSDKIITYAGIEKTIISFDLDKNIWTIRDMSNPFVYAFSQASFRTLALGNLQWTITNDTECSHETFTTTLSLTSCKSNQFTCNDGLCVNLEDRCNGQPECKDTTDEINCKVIETDQSYNRFLSPPPPLAFPKLPIYVSMKVHALSSFDPIKANYESKFSINLKWFDSRLKFNNLRSIPEANSMGPDEKDKIWFPSFIFDNTKNKNNCIIDSKSAMQVFRNGSGSLDGIESTENKHIFNGHDNYIIYDRFYNDVFECEYFLQWYPFDFQTCYVDIKPVETLKDFIQLTPDNFTYEGPLDLTQFSVKKIQMKMENEQKLRVEIVIQRRLLSIVLTTFVPTIILNIIGHMSNYFKEFFFEGLMSLNVTVMLVLTTMFLSISNNLPATAYIKMIDYWLIFNLLKPFVDIIVQTYIESLREAEEEKEDKVNEAWTKETILNEKKIVAMGDLK